CTTARSSLPLRAVPVGKPLIGTPDISYSFSSDQQTVTGFGRDDVKRLREQEHVAARIAIHRLLDEVDDDGESCHPGRPPARGEKHVPGLARPGIVLQLRQSNGYREDAPTREGGDQFVGARLPVEVDNEPVLDGILDLRDADLRGRRTGGRESI